MSRSHGKPDDAEDKVDNLESGRYVVKCKCKHKVSVPGYSQEGAQEWADKNDCNDCADKKALEWDRDHYAKMKIYNDAKRAVRIAEAEREAAEAKIKKAEAARAKRFAAENRKADNKKKTTGKKGRSAGFKTEN